MSQNTQLPLMPKATAVWLIENTALTFNQIADFCGMHELEVKGIADGEVAQGIMGQDPIMTGQLTRDEITKCENDKTAKLRMSHSVADGLISKKKAKYTPMARRQDKPDAIYWFVKNCPEVEDKKIIKLIGTTKTTIDAIRDRSHWNMQNIRPRDPVLLGLCTQTELDRVVLGKVPAPVIADTQETE
jgi:uncharacterized protein